MHCGSGTVEGQRTLDGAPSYAPNLGIVEGDHMGVEESVLEKQDVVVEKQHDPARHVGKPLVTRVGQVLVSDVQIGDPIIRQVAQEGSVFAPDGIVRLVHDDQFKILQPLPEDLPHRVLKQAPTVQGRDNDRQCRHGSGFQNGRATRADEGAGISHETRMSEVARCRRASSGVGQNASSGVGWGSTA